MLGSTAFPCLTSGPSSLRTEECLVVAYIILALLLGIVAYDYQVQLLSVSNLKVLEVQLDLGVYKCFILS